MRRSALITTTFEKYLYDSSVVFLLILMYASVRAVFPGGLMIKMSNNDCCYLSLFHSSHFEISSFKNNIHIMEGESRRGVLFGMMSELLTQR